MFLKALNELRLNSVAFDFILIASLVDELHKQNARSGVELFTRKSSRLELFACISGYLYKDRRDET